MIDLFITVRLLDIIDIVLVAYLMFELYNLIKGTAAIRIFIGIVTVFLIWWLVRILEMEMLSEILGAFISVGFIALIVVFQPEIRKFLLLLGTPSFIRKQRRRFFFWRISIGNDSPLNIDPLVKACHSMSAGRTGALIVIGGTQVLEEYIETGEKIDSRISSHLIESIFFKNSPLHDGAVIILNNRIVAARCILPVSNNSELPQYLGLRHRAALGLSERVDAIAIVVSEQTGNIALAKGSELKLNLTPAELKKILEEQFNP